MGANKFATMVHRSTNKVTLVLIYAILEWTLIVLLLLNSLFSYLIIKFADYFGLKPPCPWCSRIDHFFEPEKKQNSHRDHICEHHATEISNLGYCSIHQKLARSQDMCGDCLSSQPGFREDCQKFAFFRMEQIDLIESEGDKGSEDDDVNSKCSCCGENLVSKTYSPFVLIDPSWDVLEYTQKGNLITESGIDDPIEKSNILDRSGSELMTDQFEENSGTESKREVQMLSEVNQGFGIKETEETGEDFCVLVSKFGERETGETEKDTIKEDKSSVIKEDQDFTEILSQHLEFFVDYSGHQLVPIELIDSTSEENQIRCQVEEDHEFGDYQEAKASSDLLIEPIVDLVNKNPEELLSNQQEREELHSVNENAEELHSVLPNTEELLSVHEKVEESHSAHENTAESIYAVFDSMEMEETENSLVFHAREFDFLHEEVAITRAARTLEDIEENAAEGEDSDTDAHSVHEEVSQIPITENEADVSIGTEIPDLDSTDEIKAQENFSSYDFDHGEPSTSSPDLHSNAFEKAQEEETVELRRLSVEVSENPMNNRLSFSDLNEIEEERIPDTPTSLDSFNQLHKKLLLLERRESGAEESLDGSVISELEGGDVVSTAERLKSALRAERKALHALYAELEEERSASAVAANQTMAMINRLQEEKAAMQMEALQYQRMMEEQSEYDQEALQLLNELMVKREKEKHELERELEVYRRKVLDYEVKEKMRMLRRSKDGSARSGTCSASCSHSEDGDGISIDLNQDVKEEVESFDGHQESGNHNTPVESVLNLEDSLVDFEEERMSILEQLKVLEEKLFTLTDAEDLHFEDIRPIEDYYEENGKHLNEHSDSDGQEVNGIVNGFPKEMNGKLYQDRRLMGSKAKRLLPLFDAISTESDDGVLIGNGNGIENGFHSNKLENSAVTRFELEKKRIDIEEEVDQLYGRLQALEADREFLKHCISSLKKGDKGMDLLQEILQHLRDLRNVELRVKNFSDGPLA